MFRNYLFLVIHDRFYDAMNCPGVARLLLDGVRPAKVRDGVIEDLRSREVGGFVKLPELGGLKAGDRVRAADGEHVLTWWQAQDKARSLARGNEAGGDRPVTVAEAIEDYERDLVARGGDPVNASRVRGHLTPALLAKPVALLEPKELRRWRLAPCGALVY
jgi:hypothetical protein